jgi:NTE family protein
MQFRFGARVTFMNVGALRAEWRNDIAVGSIAGLRSEYYRPFSVRSKAFVAPRAYINDTTFDAYEGKDLLARFRIFRTGFGGDVGWLFSPTTELRVGQDFNWLKARQSIGPPVELPGGRIVGLANATLRYFGQNDAVVPTEGSTVTATARYYTSTPTTDEGYPEVEIRALTFKPISRRGSLLGGFSGGTTFGTDGLLYQSFSLGGPQRLGSFGYNQLLGNQYFLFQTGYVHQFGKSSSLLSEGVYGVATYELGKVYGAPGSPTLPNSASLTIIVKSVLGPVYVGGSAGSGRARWWFGIGRVF